MKNKLEVGDIVFEHSRWNGLVRHKITRVTAKMAFSEHYKWRREIKNGSVFRFGQYGTDDVSNPDLEHKYRLQQLKRWVDKWKSETVLTNEQYIKLYDFIKSELTN